MPYPVFTGYAPEEIDDIKEVIEKLGDVDFAGSLFRFLYIIFSQQLLI